MKLPAKAAVKNIRGNRLNTVVLGLKCLAFQRNFNDAKHLSRRIPMKKHGERKKRANYPEGLYCRGRIWIEKEGETYLGYGRIVLLTKIAEFGSILQAAKSMEMSYKQAWDLVDAMNRHAATPLVITQKGGKGGGGARLTEAGEQAISYFQQLMKRLDKFLADETAQIRL
jgi:molybdate transport system regulatory protein